MQKNFQNYVNDFHISRENADCVKMDSDQKSYSYDVKVSFVNTLAYRPIIFDIKHHVIEEFKDPANLFDDKVLSAITHDMRAPLNNAMGILQVANLEYLNNNSINFNQMYSDIYSSLSYLE